MSGMNRADRAKQFMPFAALKGYPEALRKKERIVVPRIEMTEDYAEQLDRKLPVAVDTLVLKLNHC